MSSSKIHMSCNELYKTVLNLDVVRTSEEEGNKEIFLGLMLPFATPRLLALFDARDKRGRNPTFAAVT